MSGTSPTDFSFQLENPLSGRIQVGGNFICKNIEDLQFQPQSLPQVLPLLLLHSLCLHRLLPSLLELSEDSDGHESLGPGVHSLHLLNLLQAALTAGVLVLLEDVVCLMTWGVRALPPCPTSW